MWRKARRFFVHKILHADDTPHRIALGVAVGTFVAFTPTVGFQMFIAVAIAAALRVNKVVCIPLVWITNPVTLVPIYAVCFSLGNALLGTADAAQGTATVGQIQTLDVQMRAGGFSRLVEAEFWKELFLFVTRVGAELWVGCLIIGVVAATPAYFLSRWGVTTYREQREERIAARARRRERRSFAKGMPARRPTA